MKNSKGIHPNAMVYYCCEHNQTELGKYLITEKGAKLHVTKEGLRGACFYSDLERVKIFIESGPSDLLQVPAPTKRQCTLEMFLLEFHHFLQPATIETEEASS